MPDQKKPVTASRHRRKAPGGASRTPGPRGTAGIGNIGGGRFVGEEHRLGFDDEGLHIPTGNSEVLLTRRQLLYGTAGIAAVAAVGGVAATVGGSGDAASAPDSLAVAAGDVFTLDDCAETPVSDALVMTGEYKLPHGSLVWAGNDALAACLIPTDTAKPLVRAALLSLSTGNQSIVLEQAVGQDAGFEVYDMRASEEGAIWTEANILTGEWRVYVAPISLMAFEEHRQVDQGDASQEMPTLAAIGDTAFWQVMPAAPATDDDGADEGQTHLRAVSFARPSDVRTVYTADGRCATAISPANAERGVVMTPADPEAKSRRKLLLVSADGEVADEISLPARMAPMEACYGTSGFAFSFESIYNYGDGIANLGTYTPQSKPEGGSYSNLEWFRFARTPSIPPAWCGDWFMVKSTSAVVAVHLADRRYAILPTDNNAEAYGDCLASVGANGSVVTYMNIDRTEAVQDNEQVTDDDRLCLVRVWATPDNAGSASAEYDDEDYLYG